MNMRDRSHLYVWHDLFVCVTCRIRECHMTYSCAWHVSFVFVTWRIHMCDMTHLHVWYDSFMRVIWLIHHITHMNQTYSYESVTSHVWTRLISSKWQDTCSTGSWHPNRISFTFLSYLIHISILSHSHFYQTALAFLSYDSFHSKCCIPKIHRIQKLRFLGISQYKFKLRFWFSLHLYRGIWVSGFGGYRVCSICSGNCHVVNCPSNKCHVTHMNASCYTYEWVMSHVWMNHVILMNESCHTCEGVK